MVNTKHASACAPHSVLPTRVGAALVSVAMLVCSGSLFARNSYLNDVNSTCNTSDDCTLCHIGNPSDGVLNADGVAFRDGGYDASYFCPPSPVCTDEDGDGFYVQGADCGTAADCNDANANVNPGAPEICGNGIDDNCNDLVDSQDPECGGCVPTFDAERGKLCTDEVDNDCNGFTDCEDSGCAKNRACKVPTEGKGKTCQDGMDNDQDGLFDCDDPDCSGNRACR